jgi:hypothetical protein
MKKLICILVLSFTISCSNDDDTPVEKDCSCGYVSSKGIEHITVGLEIVSQYYFYVTNDCSLSNKKFVVKESDWLRYGVEEKVCFSNKW